MIIVTRNSEYKLETNEDGISTLTLLSKNHDYLKDGEQRTGVLQFEIELGQSVVLMKGPGRFFVTSPVTEVRK